GNEYIDYILGFGPLILGHSPDAVNEAVIEQVKRGSLFSAPNYDTLEMGKLLHHIIPCAEAVSFQSSGSEVLMYAFRVARAFTGKPKIVKMEGHYHGWTDEEKISIEADRVEQLGPRDNPNKIIHTKGQRASSADDLYVIPWNDLEYLERTLKAHDDIAAVLMEPIMFDSGPIMPKPGYLEGVRELTKKYNVLLIFDEVITGFHVALGGAQQLFGVTPDLATFGKAITAGYAFAALAGRSDIMHASHPAGTFSAWPIGTVATIATIKELSKPGVYERFNELGQMLCDGYQKLGKKYGLKVYTRHTGAVATLYFGFDDDVDDLRDWIGHADVAFYQRFVQRMESYGVRMTSKRGRIYLSTQHTNEDIAKTLDIADQVLGELVAEGK
ncbi:MAG: aminotransferase class III-fold pyridoxal phosphate-dependent enzyme, partial [Oscillibacter sp.]|nr:aminotransferase class III-fold pyridoxal phosphate-dependent enzyme [Oscillibacter sp.]